MAILNNDSGQLEELSKCAAPVRDASIDVFRCILMFLIVLHHSAFHGYWAADTSMWSLPVLFTLMIFWHVDGFLAISGWYGVKFSVKRFMRIFGVVACYSVMRFVIMFFFMDKSLADSCKVTAGWFGSIYLAFMFLAPLLNEAISAVAKWNRSSVYSMWLIFNIGMVLCWRPLSAVTGFAWGGGGGCSMQTFCFVYVNMRFIRMLEIGSRIQFRHLVFAFTAYFLFVFLFSITPVIAKGMAVPQTEWIGWTTYNSPYSVLMGIAMFLLFQKYIRFPRFINSIARKISPYMFGVYIIHEATGVGRMLYTLPQQWAASCCSHISIIIFVTALMTFCICIVIEMCRVQVLNMVKSGIRLLPIGRRWTLIRTPF